MADCIIAGGAESMSYIPMGGYKPVPDYQAAKSMDMKIITGVWDLLQKQLQNNIM